MDRARPDQEGLSARRLHCAALPGPDEACELGAEAAQHAHVLRLKAGDVVELFDGRGGSLPVRIVEAGKRALRCVASGPRVQVEPGPRVVLVQCVPRGGKVDEIVRMTTELGVAAIHLALSERVVARSAGERAEHKLERLERVAVEAARQAEQPYLPEIIAPRPLAEVLREAPPGAYRCALLERSNDPLPAELAPSGEAWIAVGPEGGFSERDRGEIASAGFLGVSVGRSILRTETAAVVGVALLLDRARRGR